jgi:nicotinamidase-related amidase
MTERTRMTTIDPKKCAIVMIDMARDFVEEGGFIADAGGADYRVRAKGRYRRSDRTCGRCIAQRDEEFAELDVDLSFQIIPASTG